MAAPAFAMRAELRQEIQALAVDLEAIMALGFPDRVRRIEQLAERLGEKQDIPCALPHVAEYGGTVGAGEYLAVALCFDFEELRERIRAIAPFLGLEIAAPTGTTEAEAWFRRKLKGLD